VTLPRAYKGVFEEYPPHRPLWGRPYTASCARPDLFCNILKPPGILAGPPRRWLGGRNGFSGLRYASGMDVLKMLAELRQEHARIGKAIIVLERLALGHGNRRGRPPEWLKPAAKRKQQAKK
jgi:hypothetical protein